MIFPSFKLLVLYITMIDFCRLKQSSTLGMNPNWSWCIIFFTCCYFICQYFLKEFSSIFRRDIDLYSFLVLSLADFHMHLILASKNELGNFPSSSTSFWRSLWGRWYSFFFKCLIEFTNEAPWVCIFLCGKFSWLII